MELVGDRATPRDMLALADESVPLGEAFAMPINAGSGRRASRRRAAYS